MKKIAEDYPIFRETIPRFRFERFLPYSCAITKRCVIPLLVLMK